MDEMAVRNLIGEYDYTTLLIELDDRFYKFQQATKDAFWKAVLVQINSGTVEIEKLVSFAKSWLWIYDRIKAVVHQAKEI